jgi:hypothetical protein
MALLFVDGFDAGDFVAKGWSSVGGTITSSVSTRFGAGRSMQLNTNGFIAKRSFTPSASIYVGAAMYSGSTSDPIFHTYTDTGVTSHIYLKSLGSALGLYHGNGTLIGQSAPNTWADRRWHYVEIYLVVADAGGRATMRINGATQVDFTGDTRNGGTSTNIDTIGFRGRFNGDDAYFDDLYICDATGTTNNNFLGDIRVQTIVPTGAGTYTDLTPTGVANNWDNVNELPASVTDYNSSSTIGHKDSYVMSDVLATTGSVFGIQTNIMAHKSDASAASIRSLVRVSGTDYNDATIGLGTGAATYSAIREQNPATSTAWTPSDVNSIEAGVEVQ